MKTDQIKREIRIFVRIADLRRLAADTTLAYDKPVTSPTNRTSPDAHDQKTPLR
jgi:hypothetical protein